MIIQHYYNLPVTKHDAYTYWKSVFHSPLPPQHTLSNKRFIAKNSSCFLSKYGLLDVSFDEKMLRLSE